MPRAKRTNARTTRSKPNKGPVGDSVALERKAFVRGMYEELESQLLNYTKLTSKYLTLQARVQVAERAVQVTRDHFESVFATTGDEKVPSDWEDVLAKVRFVGVRLGSACIDLLRENESLSVQELHDLLNGGEFRFRSPTPLREINGALLRYMRQGTVQREDDRYTYTVEEVEVA